jgi:acyl CoA:acetate/3-ketoacid CoA transferase beta subunit
MNEQKPANVLEMLCYIMALEIRDYSTVYIGTGLPMISSILARKTHAPNITVVYESGGQDPIEGDMPWSVGDPFTWRKSPTIMEMPYSFGQCYNGYVDLAFLGFAQIDMYGNVNTHQIGKDLLNPVIRLTGSGGNNDLTSLTEKMILVGLQTKERFPEHVDFITSVGHLEGGSSRKDVGLLGEGPVGVITQWGVYDFEPVSKRMRIKSLTPGIPFDIAQQTTGFELLKPEGDISESPMIPPEILAILRRDVDPRGIFTTMPS